MSKKSKKQQKSGTAVPSAYAPVVLDIAGTELTKADRKRLKNPLTGGLILFARNWSEAGGRQALTRLCADIKKARPDLLVCVDHEGGRVQRFKEGGFTHLPPMRALGEMWMQSEDDGQSSAMHATHAATACGFVLGAELRACGIDLSFTPVLDLDHGPSGVIGDRAFARDPRVVALLAKSLMHGMLAAGMANCGKHFPGHGFASADSHFDAAVDPRPLAELLADDAAPYGWLGGALSAVMPAHVIYTQVDARPAGFSKRWLGEILRGRLAFGGLIFSDDLSMNAARRLDGRDLSYTDAALAALDAGCDMVLLCNQSQGAGEEVDELLAGLTQALADGRLASESQQRERRLALLPRAAPMLWDDLMV
ncbi:MAG: beta-N-acetylhexosaminidase, partial [Burkholderiales bacterium]